MLYWASKLNITYILHKIPLLKSLFKLQRLSLIYLIQYTKILIQVTLSKKKNKKSGQECFKKYTSSPLLYFVYLKSGI